MGFASKPGGVVPHESYFFFETTLHPTSSFRGRAAPFVGFADISPHRGESPLTQGSLTIFRFSFSIHAKQYFFAFLISTYSLFQGNSTLAYPV